MTERPLVPPSERWGLGSRRLYLCTPDRPDLGAFVAGCIEGGVDVVQLRDKQLADEEILRRSELLLGVCGPRGVPFVLNDRPDLAQRAGADGVHVGQDDADPAAARTIMGTGALVGLSTHSEDDLERAVAGDEPIDYVSAGPVVPTPTKPGRPGTGPDYVRLASARSPWPVWITGGVTPATVPALTAAGARHFVVVRFLTEADEPRVAARELRRTIDRAVGPDP